MIEVTEIRDANPEITEKLAESGLRVFKDFCTEKRQQPGKCNRCTMLPFCMKNFKITPDGWEV